MSKNKNVLIVDREKYPRVPLDVLGFFNGDNVEIVDINDNMRFNNFQNILQPLLFRYMDGCNIVILNGDPVLLTKLSRLHIRWSIIIDHNGFYEMI